MTPREAVAELLGGSEATAGDDESVLWRAGARSWLNRERNSMLGGVVFEALNHLGYPYRDMAVVLAEVLGRDVAEVPFQTLQRWAAPPPEIARGEGADR